MRTHIAGLGAAGLLSWAGLAAADPWDRSFKVTGKPAVRIETDDGSVRVSAWDRPEVTLHVATQRWRIAPSGVTVSARQAGERIELIARTPRFEWNLWGGRSLEITVHVPRQSDLEVQTGDGSIRIDPLDMSITGAATQPLSRDHLNVADPATPPSCISMRYS